MTELDLTKGKMISVPMTDEEVLVGLPRYTSNEAKEALSECEIPPDDIIINGKHWSLEATHVKRTDALADVEFMTEGRMFKYPQGYAVYSRSYLYE